MKIIKCKNCGNLYNIEAYNKCPNCVDESLSDEIYNVVNVQTGKDHGANIHTPVSKEDSSPMVAITPDGNNEDYNPTIAEYYTEKAEDSSQKLREIVLDDEILSEDNDSALAEACLPENEIVPVHTEAYVIKQEFPLGLLIVTEGLHKGHVFKLYSGQNSLGRNVSMTVALDMDETVSREKHCIFRFDDEENCFISPGSQRGITRLNNKILLEESSISNRDVIAVGKSKLMFIKVCIEGFRWNEEEQQ